MLRIVKRIVKNYKQRDPNDYRFERNVWGFFEVVFINEKGESTTRDVILTSEDLGENITKTTNSIGVLICKVNGIDRTQFDGQKFFDRMVDDLDFWDYQTRMMLICSYGYECGIIEKLNLDEDGFINGYELKSTISLNDFTFFTNGVNNMKSVPREELMFHSMIELRGHGTYIEMVS